MIDTLTVNTTENNPQIMATNNSDSTAIDQLNTAIDARVAELAQMDEKLQARLEQERREMEAQFERRLERELQARLNAMSVSNNQTRNEGAQVAPHTFEQVTQAIVALRAQDPILRKPEPFSAPSQTTNTKVFLCNYEHYIKTAYPGDEGACARYLSTYLTGKACQWYDRTIRNSANRDNYQIVKDTKDTNMREMLALYSDFCLPNKLSQKKRKPTRSSKCEPLAKKRVVCAPDIEAAFEFGGPGQTVAVAYEEAWYIGRVVLVESRDKATIQFLVAIQAKPDCFKWPAIEDTDDVNSKFVLKSGFELIPHGRYFKAPNQTLQDIKDCYEQYKDKYF